MWIVLAALAAGTAGCSMPLRNPWDYIEPPTTAQPRSPQALAEANRTVIVLGTFGDPTLAPQYSQGVGRRMSEALSRALLNEGRFDVWINPQLTSSVEQVISMPTFQHEQGLGTISDENPRVHYVITGKVTDFYHTADLPEYASRWGIFGRRNEALVALDLRIVDLKTRRVVGADHFKANANAGYTPSEEIYSGIALDSYLFWSTPLGRASKMAVERALERTSQVVPGASVGEARVASLSTRRQISIAGGTDAGLAAGRDYYLVLPTPDYQGRAVFDPDTGLPLRVRIASATRQAAEGFLRGRAPIELDIRGAALRDSLPPVPKAAMPAATVDSSGASPDPAETDVRAAATP